MQEITIDKFGTKRYFWSNKLHREDGPAIKYINGYKQWYHHGQRHREGGPAIDYVNGFKKWYLQGESYSEEEYWRLVKLKALW
jgi:hypothetical protein